MAKNGKPGKKKPEEIQQNPLLEIEMSVDDWNDLERGVNLFNERKFWHAHEAWEEVWNRHEEDERLFFQAIIQLTAAYHHLLSRTNYRGILNNLEKALPKLEVFSPHYLGMAISPLIESLQSVKTAMIDLGPEGLPSFNLHYLPKIQFQKPKNPDLTIELKYAIETEEFIEGVKLFNSGYYWEAKEAWEDLWREQTGDAKALIHLFVQAAAGYSFIKQAKPSAAKYLFEKSIERFESYQENISGVSISALTASMRELLATIDHLGPDGHHARSAHAYPKIIIKK